MLQLPFDELYDLSIEKPELVWDEFAQQVTWDKPYDSVIDGKDSPIPNWFVGGEINMSYNCLDRAIEEGHGDDVAIIYESPVTNTSEKITYKQLLQSVELLAGVLVEKCDIAKGDRVLLYFPVIPQCLMAMLACARIGAIYSLVYGGFPPKPISDRIQYIEPKLVMTCNVGYRAGTEINYKNNIDKALEMEGFVPDYCLVYNRPNTEPGNMIDGRDLDWAIELDLARPQGPVPVESNHPLFIIYSSGTTGEPKGFVMGTGNSVVSNTFLLRYMIDMKPRECFFMISDYVWISGQTLLGYGPLLTRLSTVVYEGEYTSQAAAMHITRILKQHSVNSVGLSPTLIRALRNHLKDLDLDQLYPNLKMAYFGGEISDSSTREWFSNYLNSPIFDLWGQTELNGVVTTPGHAFGRIPTENAVPSLGCKFVVVDTQTGEECPLGSVGRVLLKTPGPPSMALTIYKDHDRYLKKYYEKYPGYFDTMDSGRLRNDGSLEILSRMDDIIHVQAVRICGGAVEEICLKNQDVICAAVIPLYDELYGQVPFAFLMKKNGVTATDEEIVENTINLVNEHIGDYAKFQKAVVVTELPLTRSYKISRYSLAAMVNGEEYTVPSTVENVKVYYSIQEILIKNGYNATLPTDISTV